MNIDSPLRHPWVATALLAWTIGVFDTSTYLEFGVFTSNQAGNLVVAATEIFREPAAAALPLISLGGAIVGAVMGNILGRRYPDVDDRAVTAPLAAAMVLLLVTAALDLLAVQDWAVISVAAAALACLAVAVIRAPAVGMWLTANTGQLLSAVQGLAELRSLGWSGLPPIARVSIIAMLGFCLGAAAVGSGLLSDNAIVLAVGPAVVGLWLGAASLRRR